MEHNGRGNGGYSLIFYNQRKNNRLFLTEKEANPPMNLIL